MPKRGSKSIERAESDSSKKQKTQDSNETKTNDKEDPREHKAPALAEPVMPTSEYTGASRILPPFNFQKWINEHKDMLQPPVNAKLLFEESMFIIMVVGGPNRRTDYHINMTEEFFFQIKGNMCLKVVVEGKFEDIEIKEGEMFLLPANTPHSPQRFEDTIGLVVEQKRRPGIIDRLRWYCEKCKEVVFEESFHVQTLDLGSALKPVIEGYYDSDEKRTCKKCGHVDPVPPARKKSNSAVVNK